MFIRKLFCSAALTRASTSCWAGQIIHVTPAQTPGTQFTFKHGISIGHWLAKFDEKIGYGGDWFGEADLTWLAEQGFDHLRFPVDSRLWRNDDGSLNLERIAVFEKALSMTKAKGMGVVLDMHFLPGGKYQHSQQDPAVFTDIIEQKKAVDFIGKLGKHFVKEGDALRIELLNEPSAPEPAQLNALYKNMIAAVRAHDKQRVLYIAPNLSSNFAHLAALEIPKDPKVAILVLYDEPTVFTHQRTSWKDYPDDMPPIDFPGTVPDLSAYLKPSHYAYKESGKQLTRDAVQADFAKAQQWLKEHAPDKEIYLGVFGVYQKAPEGGRRNYLETVRLAAESQGWGWCVWDYKSVFGLRRQDNSVTPAIEGLFSKPPQ
ncbi:glycoside hydrolase family 5 protein [Cellvibrio sp.]|uniref:glycoside hydrolase family 5 protein n=1 Tax=Cellvibrio sp. TaxID=1965322 RepID=UPI0039647E09